MYILKNSWINIVRSKGRNLLIGIIITIITISALVSLSINKSSKNLKENYINSNPVEVSFSLDMKSIRNERFENSDLTIETIDEDEIKNYGDSKYVKDYYYTYQKSLSSDDIYAINISDIFKKEDSSDENKPNDMMRSKTVSQGDFRFVAYSDIAYIENFLNGTNKIISGSIFDNDSEANVIVISSDLAEENDLEVNDKIKFYDPEDTDKVYEFEIVAIYEDTSTNDDNFMNMNIMNSQNQIYTTMTAIKSMIDENDTNNISAKFYLTSSDDIEKFKEEVTKKGLSSYYTLNDNQDTILETLKPVENISNFSMTFLIIILIVGIIILIVINMINIRDRKYEIGVLRAIGMNKLKVSLELILELFIVSLVSLIIGTLIGISASQPITNKMLENEINSYTEEKQEVENNFGRGNIERKGFNKMESNQNIDYVDNLNVKIDIYTILQLFGVVILITIISGSITIISINKYEPNKILQNRV